MERRPIARGRRAGQSWDHDSAVTCLERAHDLVDEELDVVVRQALRLHDRVHVRAHQRSHQVATSTRTHAQTRALRAINHKCG